MSTRNMDNIQLITDNLDKSALPLFVFIGNIVFLLVTAVLLQRMTQKLRREYSQVKVIREDLKAFSVAAIGMGKRVLQLEHRHTVENIQTKKVVSYVEPANQSYDEAAHMARQGKNVESIMHQCGLSHSEAELIFLMNRLDKAG